MTKGKPRRSFKNPNYISAVNHPGTRGKTYKSLKQIINAQRNKKWPPDTPIYSAINAPPSLVPAKKYSDISGLKGPYKDPHSKLRYNNADEFAIVQNLPSDIINGYLQLRGQSSMMS